MVRHAVVLFRIFFFSFTQVFFLNVLFVDFSLFNFFLIFCIFYLYVSIDSFEPVCLCSLSFSWWFCPHSFISVGGWQAVTGFICRPVVSAWGADALWPPYRAVWPSFLCTLWWSLSLICFGSCIILPFFHAAGTTMTFVWLSKLIADSFTHWLIVFFFVSACMERKYCTFSIMWLCSPHSLL